MEVLHPAKQQPSPESQISCEPESLGNESVIRVVKLLEVIVERFQEASLSRGVATTEDRVPKVAQVHASDLDMKPQSTLVSIVWEKAYVGFTNEKIVEVW